MGSVRGQAWGAARGRMDRTPFGLCPGGECAAGSGARTAQLWWSHNAVALTADCRQRAGSWTSFLRKKRVLSAGALDESVVGVPPGPTGRNTLSMRAYVTFVDCSFSIRGIELFLCEWEG